MIGRMAPKVKAGRRVRSPKSARLAGQTRVTRRKARVTLVRDHAGRRHELLTRGLGTLQWSMRAIADQLEAHEDEDRAAADWQCPRDFLKAFIRPDTSLGRTLLTYVAGDPQWARLKRCEQCTRWFVDTSRSNIARRCSPDCTSRWWTRTRRRAAGHRGL
jgi:predicted RNA-binding Zn ribbon-like protein